MATKTPAKKAAPARRPGAAHAAAPPAPPAGSDLAKALQALRDNHQAIEAAKLREVELVAAVRNLPGGTWDQVAAVLGMHQPHAVKKFKPHLDEHRVVRVRTPAKR